MFVLEFFDWNEFDQELNEIQRMDMHLVCCGDLLGLSLEEYDGDYWEYDGDCWVDEEEEDEEE